MRIVTVLGGYGVFGSRVAEALAGDSGITVRVAGRRPERARAVARRIGAQAVECRIDEPRQLAAALEGAALVIDAAGPFQTRDYRVARTAIERGASYLDLADGREYVNGIGALDAAARAAGVTVLSGASSVPALSDAMVAELASDLDEVDEITLALSPGNKNPRGASTVAAILSYVGRPVRMWTKGQWETRAGWSAPVPLAFPAPVGIRRAYLCEVPDLDLFPERYRARTVHFRAGLEIGLFNRALGALSALRSRGLTPPLEKLGRPFLAASRLVSSLGTKNGVLAVWVRGRRASESVERRLAFVTDDDAPAMPSAPAIVLARQHLHEALPIGAAPCLGVLDLDEVTEHLARHGVWRAEDEGTGEWVRAGD